MRIEYIAIDKNNNKNVFTVDYQYTKKENDAKAFDYVCNYMDLSNEPYTIQQTGYFYAS